MRLYRNIGERVNMADREGVSVAARIGALDVTKGVLVYVMVVYHWLNYFVVAEFDIYRYLRFLTPSFIFITGFLIARARLHGSAQPDRQSSMRLIRRGLKLLGLFLFLNILVNLTVSRTPVAWADVIDVFVTGDVVGEAGGKVASFNILVPIAYLLLAFAVLLYATGANRQAFSILAAGVFAFIFILNLQGVESSILELVAIGILGAAIGTTDIERINRWSRRRLSLFLAYMVYLGAITAWNVVFWLQIPGVCLSLLIIYAWGLKESTGSRIRRHLSLAGRYSLLGYIGQVFILQLLRRGLQGATVTAAADVGALLAGVVLTGLLIEGVNMARRASSHANRAYETVFS